MEAKRKGRMTDRSLWRFINVSRKRVSKFIHHLILDTASESRNGRNWRKAENTPIFSSSTR
jgi:hypothetical protein